MVNTIAVVAGGAADSLRNVYLILRGREFLAPDRVIPSVERGHPGCRGPGRQLDELASSNAVTNTRTASMRSVILPIGGRVAFAPWVFSPHAEGQILCVGPALTCVPHSMGGTHVAADCFTIPRTDGGTGSRLLRAHGTGAPAGFHLELSVRPGLPFARVPSSLSRGIGSHLGRGGVGPGREHNQWKPCQRSRPLGAYLGRCSLVECVPDRCCRECLTTFGMGAEAALRERRYGETIQLNGPGLGCHGDESLQCCAFEAAGQEVIAQGTFQKLNDTQYILDDTTLCAPRHHP